MGHETVDNHNLSKHITDHIFLGTKILIRFYHKLFVINFGPCTNLALNNVQTLDNQCTLSGVWILAQINLVCQLNQAQYLFFNSTIIQILD